MIKKILIIFLLLVMFLCPAYRKPYKSVVDAERDAFLHNNIGLNYLKDKLYYAAIQEFKIAISLSPSSQASAIFKNNLGNTYMFMNYPDLAKPCFEESVELYNLNFQYYLDLVNCYKKLQILESKIDEFKSSKDLYERILLGLMYLEIKEFKLGINILDEIVIKEPNLLITPAIKKYINDTICKINS